MNSSYHSLAGSELRQDLVTGDWVVIATERAKRPDDFMSTDQTDLLDPTIDPFINPDESNQEKDVLIYYRSNGEWSLRVFPNKFPSFSENHTVQHFEEGPYFGMTGYGYHELIVPRDPKRHFALMHPLEVSEIFDAYQERYLTLMNKRNVRYIGIIHNHGKSAGASIAHPHSQLMAVPVISPYLELELSGSERYYRTQRRNVYTVMVDYEIEASRRVVFENEYFVVFCPYASRAAFEMWVFPKTQQPYFERSTHASKIALGDAFHRALRSLYDALGNPSYNFYIHTAPCDGKDYRHFRWHIEIIPRTTVWAGFELSTGIEISTIQPEVAAEHLRKYI